MRIKNRSNQVGELAAPIADSYDKNTSNDSISNSNKNVKKSSKDSDGNTLSPQQQEYFSDSKVSDENGKNDWEYWTTYIQDKNNTIWEATLNIANTSNGKKI